MSLINFLNPKLKPGVESDVVCEDGYEVTNLISDDAEQLLRGFMAFSVTKPPVEIIFDFPKAIDLKVIKLWHSHGALKSTAFEIHGKYEGIWERVAFVRDVAKDTDSVTFCYQSDYSSRSSEQQSSEKVFFFKTAYKMLSNTKSIKLIIRATQKCPPVLRKIQIWGLPARSLEKVDRELIKSIWNEITDPYNYQDKQNEADLQQRSSMRCIPELNGNSSLQIPEEFLDAITWELMIFPTVLPSGKVVDQSTIDKHSEEEAKWGRLPSDPFTGLEFTFNRKAILNLALKARIEKFLMENSEHFKTVPRSLGSARVKRSKNRHVSQIANLCQPNNTFGTYSSLSKSYKKTTATATRSYMDNTNVNTTYAPPMKRTRLAVDADYLSTALKRRSCDGVLSVASTATQTLATASLLFTNATAQAANNMNSGKVTSSPSSNIDKALQVALSKITKYTEMPAEEIRPDVCINCNSSDFAYKIQTCHHLLCRQCLVQLAQHEKCICNESFHTSDIERYHKF